MSCTECQTAHLFLRVCHARYKTKPGKKFNSNIFQYRVINTVYLNLIYSIFIHSVSLLEKTNHQLDHKNNKDMFS